MAALVIAEHDKAHLRGGTANAVTAAAKMGGEVHLLVAGSGARAAADEGARLAGVTKVLHVDAAHYDGGIPENYAALVVPMAKGYSHIVASATAFGKNIMPRIAALLDVAAASGSGSVEALAAGPDKGQSKVLSQELTKSTRPELAGARRIVSGGRGLASGENFKMLDALADKLG